ncbi:hypothetical protein [Cysteiniphilum litorale]|uniref:hypothetical protein n=1 Tax=Cysteiniphilum litorale TaxID=2056700 RepID=UPI003F88036B
MLTRSDLLALQTKVKELCEYVKALSDNDLCDRKEHLNGQLYMHWNEYLLQTNQNIDVKKSDFESYSAKNGMLEALKALLQIIEDKLLTQLDNQNITEKVDSLQVVSEKSDLELEQTISTYINNIYDNVLSELESDNNSGNDHLIRNYIDEISLKVVDNFVSAEKISKGYLDLLYQKTVKEAHAISNLESNGKFPIQQENFTAEINNSSSQQTHKRAASMSNLATKDVFTQSNTTEMTRADNPFYDQEDNANKGIKGKDNIEDITQKLLANQEPKYDPQALVKFIDWQNIKALVKKLGGTFKKKGHDKDGNPFAEFTKDKEHYTLSQNNENGVITLSAQNSSFKQFAKTLTALVAAKIQSQPGEDVTVTFKHVGNATKEEYLSALEELKALGGKCNVTINKDPSCDNELFNEALRAIEKSNEKPMPFKEKIESKPAENDPVQET